MCNLNSIRIELCNSMHSAIDFVDTGDVGIHQVDTGKQTSFHSGLQIFNRSIDEARDGYTFDCFLAVTLREKYTKESEEKNP